MSALPAKYRVPLYLYYYEGYSATEIGELLGLYQEMFDEVRASGKLRQEVMKMTNTERMEKKRHHLPKAAVIAAVIAVTTIGGSRWICHRQKRFGLEMR